MLRKVLLGGGVSALAATAIITDERQSRTVPMETVVRHAKSIVTRYKECAVTVVLGLQEEHGAVGIAVAVSIDGCTVWTHGTGYANVETLTPCTPRTCMQIASISKTMTAVRAMRLVDEGKLDLDKPVREYLPSYPPMVFDGKEYPVTTRQLLSHLGGVRHYDTKQEIDEKKKTGKFTGPMGQSATAWREMLLNKAFTSTTEALSLFQDDELIIEPGTEYSYTTHGFSIVAAVLEVVDGGTTFDTQMKNMFRELALYDTAFDANDSIVKHRANYYMRDARHRLQNVPQVDVSYKHAGGGVVSTVGDLLKYAHVLLHCRQYDHTGPRPYVRRSTMETMWRSTRSTKDGEYALGWRVSTLDDEVALPLAGRRFATRRAFVAHSGGSAGASSYLLIRPCSKTEGDAVGGVCVALLVNTQATGGLERLALDLSHEFDFESAETAAAGG